MIVLVAYCTQGWVFGLQFLLGAWGAPLLLALLLLTCWLPVRFKVVAFILICLGGAFTLMPSVTGAPGFWGRVGWGLVSLCVPITLTGLAVALHMWGERLDDERLSRAIRKATVLE